MKDENVREDDSSETSKDEVPATEAESGESDSEKEKDSKETSDKDEKISPQPTVPVGALYEERKRRQSAEKKLSDLEQRLQELESASASADDDEFTQEQLETFSKAAKKLGFVSNKELESLTIENERKLILNEFYKKHPEYSPGNDPYNKKWESLSLVLENYNLSSPDKFRMALEKSAKELGGNEEKSNAEMKAYAKIEKNMAASVGGGGASVSDDDVTLTPEEKRNAQHLGIDEKYMIQAKAKRLSGK